MKIEKQKIALGLNVVLLLVSLIATAQTSPLAFKLDERNSKIFWKGPTSVGHKHHGYLRLQSGTLVAPTENTYSRADFVIDMQSIQTQDDQPQAENEKVNVMLKGRDFFWVGKFPKGTIQINEISSTSSAFQYKVVGRLTLKGVTKPIQFLAVIKRNGKRVTATANFEIDRHAWGIDSKKSDNTFSFLKDKLIEDFIPISLDLMFVAK